jgi:hypothetical protein
MAIFLVLNRLGVEIVLARAGTACVEGARAVVLDFARSGDRKPRGGRRSNVTLELCGGGRKNAATSARVGDLSV